MKALLIIAHGSRRKQSNQEVVSLAHELQQHPDCQFPLVEAAFLELAEPSIPEGVAKCVEKGAHEVTVVPYFLNSGRHVVEDIPAEIHTAKAHHPHVKILVSPHLGASTVMAGLVLDTASQAE